MKGKLNLFELDPQISAEVEKQLAQPAPTIAHETVEQVVAAIQTPLIDLRQWQMNSYINLRDVDALNRLSSRVIEEFPESDLGYGYPAVALVELSEWEAAIADATKAIELDPSNFGAPYSRAIARFELGDLEGAKADWQRAKELGAEIPEFEALERGEA